MKLVLACHIMCSGGSVEGPNMVFTLRWVWFHRLFSGNAWVSKLDLPTCLFVCCIFTKGARSVNCTSEVCGLIKSSQQPFNRCKMLCLSSLISCMPSATYQCWINLMWERNHQLTTKCFMLLSGHTIFECQSWMPPGDVLLCERNLFSGSNKMNLASDLSSESNHRF